MSGRTQSSHPDRQARLRSLIDDNRRLVARTLRRAGVRRAELDDEIQRTFIIVAGRLDDVSPGSEKGFLCQVARNTAWHARRSLGRRREFASDELPEQSAPIATPEHLVMRKQIRASLDAALAGMNESLRSVFLLAEIDQIDTRAIARRLRIPRGTVASRLRRARTQMRRSLAAIELALDLGIEGAERMEGPAVLRREKLSGLERALLAAGAKKRPSDSMHARTLAACLASARG